MKQAIFLFCVFATTVFGQSGRITGVIVDDSGAPIVGASVMASLWESAKPVAFVPGRPPAFMPVPAKQLSGPKGEFEVTGLVAGRYYVCVDKPEDAILNPCLWADPPVPVEVGEDATVSQLSIVATRGVALQVRVSDVQGLLKENPANDDVRVGTFHRRNLFIPGMVTDRDPAGKVMTVIVPRGQDVTISVSSAAFVLADASGNAMTSPEIPVPAAVVSKGGSTPPVTVQVTGTKPHP